jgi:hypothetical protein
MIVLPFAVRSRNKRYDFIDSKAIDSLAEQTRIQQVITASLQLMQKDAMCEALGIESTTQFTPHGFGVYDGASPVGVFLIAALAHQSGVWRDPHNGDWEVIDSKPAVFHARPMPGFAIPEAEALDLSTDAAHHFLSSKTLATANGNRIEFRRLSWAIFKARTDPLSQAARRMHEHARPRQRK